MENDRLCHRPRLRPGAPRKELAIQRCFYVEKLPWLAFRAHCRAIDKPYSAIACEVLMAFLDSQESPEPPPETDKCQAFVQVPISLGKRLDARSGVGMIPYSWYLNQAVKQYLVLIELIEET